MSKWTKVSVVVLIIMCVGIIMSVYHAYRYQQQEAMPQEDMAVTDQQVGEQSDCGLDCGEPEEEVILVEEPTTDEGAPQQSEQVGQPSEEGEFVADKD
ncbi:MAG TPA: hypothetical protein VLG71_00770 [Candidatus Limnocylindria bacterium]|nr:hypothetical protein [Candidatus Limnocylindria bacterium]